MQKSKTMAHEGEKDVAGGTEVDIESLDPGHPLRRRATIMAAVETANEERRVKEGWGGVPAEAPKTDTKTEEGPAPVAEKQEEAATEGEEKKEPETKEGEKAVEAKPPETVTVIVDGESRQVPMAEVIASYQIDSAARRRLQEASETLKRARAYEEQARTSGEGHPTAEKEEPKDSQVDFVSLAKSLQYDDPEKAGQALAQAVSRIVEASGNKLSPEAIIEEATARARAQAEYDGALSRFAQEYADILNIPNSKVGAFLGFETRRAVIVEQQAARSERRQPRPFWSILQQVGNETRELLKAHIVPRTEDTQATPAKPNGSGNAQPRVAVGESRIAEKRTSVNPPSARTMQQSAQTQPALTPEEQIEAERKQALKEIIEARQGKQGTS